MSAIKANRRILSVAERSRLRKEERNIEMEQGGAIPEADRRMSELIYNPARGNNVNENNALLRIRKALKDGDPGSLTKHERAAIERRMEEIRPIIIKSLLPLSMYSQRQSDGHGNINPMFNKAVNLLIKNECSQQVSQLKNEYQNGMRLLNPDDPDASNVELLRPEK